MMKDEKMDKKQLLITRQVELLLALQAEIDTLRHSMSLTHVPCLLTKIQSGDDYSDPALNFTDNNVSVSVCSNKDGEEIFDIGYIVRHPGVHYYPDGSGEPPSEDYIEVETVPAAHILTAAKETLKLAFDHLLDDVVTGRSEDLLPEIEPPVDEPPVDESSYMGGYWNKEDKED